MPVTVSEQLSNLLNGTLKQLIAVFTKPSPYLEIISREYSQILAVLGYQTLISINISFDLRIKSGLLFIHSFSVIPKRYSVDLVSPYLVSFM